jgi:hypothetical protein
VSRPPLAAVPGTGDTGSERVLRALREQGKRFRGDGPQWQAQCPAHDDHSPSLGIKQVEGQVLIICRAGCTWDKVVAALGLAPSDLFDNRRGVHYRYDDGRIVHRKFNRDGKKTFPQSGKTKAEKGTAALYRLTQVKAAAADGRTIYVVEGEKDVHALESIGLVATTAPRAPASGTWSTPPSSQGRPSSLSPTTTRPGCGTPRRCRPASPGSGPPSRSCAPRPAKMRAAVCASTGHSHGSRRRWVSPTAGDGCTADA